MRKILEGQRNLRGAALNELAEKEAVRAFRQSGYESFRTGAVMLDRRRMLISHGPRVLHIAISDDHSSDLWKFVPEFSDGEVVEVEVEVAHVDYQVAGPTKPSDWDRRGRGGH